MFIEPQAILVAPTVTMLIPLAVIGGFLAVAYLYDKFKK